MAFTIDTHNIMAAGSDPQISILIQLLPVILSSSVRPEPLFGMYQFFFILYALF